MNTKKAIVTTMIATILMLTLVILPTVVLADKWHDDCESGGIPIDYYAEGFWQYYPEGRDREWHPITDTAEISTNADTYAVVIFKTNHSLCNIDTGSRFVGHKVPLPKIQWGSETATSIIGILAHCDEWDSQWPLKDYVIAGRDMLDGFHFVEMLPLPGLLQPEMKVTYRSARSNYETIGGVGRWGVKIDNHIMVWTNPGQWVISTPTPTPSTTNTPIPTATTTPTNPTPTPTPTATTTPTRKESFLPLLVK